MRNRLLPAWILLVLIGQITPVIPKPLSDDTLQIPVISSSAPVYPSLAEISQTKGTVLVDVKIDSDGRVVSAKATEGHPLLRTSAEMAARLWKFQAVSSGTNYRNVRLTFIFNIVLEESTETRDEGLFIPPARFEVIRKIATIVPLPKTTEQLPDEGSFIPPFHFKMIWKPATVATLPRTDRQLPKERCPLHGEELKLDIVPIIYGLPMSETRYTNVDVVSLLRNAWSKLTYQESYFDARRVKFPNSQMHRYGGCMVGYERKAEVLYCQRCREIEAKWRKKHPGKGVRMVAVISGGSGQ